MKEGGVAYEKPDAYLEIKLPHNTAKALIAAGCAFLFAFAVIWNIWWLAIVAALGGVFTIIARSSENEPEYTISVAEIERIEHQRYQQLQTAGAQDLLDQQAAL